MQKTKKFCKSFCVTLFEKFFKFLKEFLEGFSFSKIFGLIDPKNCTDFYEFPLKNFQSPPDTKKRLEKETLKFFN